MQPLLQQPYLARHATLLNRQALLDALRNGWNERSNGGYVWQNSQQLNVEIYIYTVEVYLFKLVGHVIVAS